MIIKFVNIIESWLLLNTFFDLIILIMCFLQGAKIKFEILIFIVSISYGSLKALTF